MHGFNLFVFFLFFFFFFFFNKVLLELLKKLRIPSSLGSSIVEDKSSTDPVSSGPNVTYKKKKKAQRKYDSRKEKSTVILPLGRHSNGPSGNSELNLAYLHFRYCLSP